MQFKLTSLAAITVLASAVVAAPSAEPQKVPCDLQPNHPCQLYNRFPACEATWDKLLTLCQASGCVKWVRDPKADCKKTPKA
ncbi:hypothetical protein BJ508DRAFT_321311 [Ascobolus immersus RN42]|uniref:Uncharacterized protein n=1 Tax=Ascobolus immersus RN42 TaxID=1160509 RepID=A0A3N4IKR5_ASCIM|nr:hypothetical protein BJ508DRAFT_321311 [Ascobolus immersus RN42]